MKRLMVAVVVLSLSMVAVSEARAPKPRDPLPGVVTQPGTNGLLAYVQGNYGFRKGKKRIVAGIYTFNLKTDKRKLIVASDSAQTPTFSADGKVVFYLDNVDGQTCVFRVSTSGKNRKRLTVPRDHIYAGNLLVLRSGRIAFTRGAGHPTLFSMNPDGTGLKDVFPFEGSQLLGSVSHTGRKVAYRRCVSEYSNKCDIWMFTRATGERKRIRDGRNGSPVFSSKTNQIAYLRGTEVRIMRADGSRDELIRRPDEGEYVGDAVFSPDGKKLIVPHGSINTIYDGPNAWLEIIDLKSGNTLRRVVGPYSRGSVYDVAWQAR